jgi:hypothetical protein
MTADGPDEYPTEQQEISNNQVNPDVKSGLPLRSSGNGETATAGL